MENEIESRAFYLRREDEEWSGEINLRIHLFCSLSRRERGGGESRFRNCERSTRDRQVHPRLIYRPPYRLRLRTFDTSDRFLYFTPPRDLSTPVTRPPRSNYQRPPPLGQRLETDLAVLPDHSLCLLPVPQQRQRRHSIRRPELFVSRRTTDSR